MQKHVDPDQLTFIINTQISWHKYTATKEIAHDNLIGLNMQVGVADELTY